MHPVATIPAVWQWLAKQRETEIRIIAGILALASLFFASQAAAQVTTYTFTGGLYATFNNSAGCTVGECATYTNAQRAVVTLTFAAPLAANLPLADRSAAVTAYSFSDGIRTTTGPGANAALYTISIGTDATGAINNYTLVIQRTPGPPYTAGAPADPNSRYSYVNLTPAATNVFGNYECGTRSAVGGGAVTGPGVCNNPMLDGSSSNAFSGVATVVTSAPVVAAVPTLSEWALILLGLMLAGGAALYLQRRQMTV